VSAEGLRLHYDLHVVDDPQAIVPNVHSVVIDLGRLK
jgi:hypothetical protein